MLDAKIVGKTIQQIRERKKMSQELVSGLAGIGRTHLSAIERGERKPTLETFYRIAEALNMRPSNLLEEIEKGNKLLVHFFQIIKSSRQRLPLPGFLYSCLFR